MAEMVPAVLSPARRGLEDPNGDCSEVDRVQKLGTTRLMNHSNRTTRSRFLGL